MFGRLPEDHPLMNKVRRRKAQGQLEDEAQEQEKQPSFKQRDPEAWARQILTNWREETRERREKKSDGE